MRRTRRKVQPPSGRRPRKPWPAGGMAATAAINGMSMYYEVHGEGEPLLLLHGFGGAASDWAGIAALLPLHYRLIVPELRGHGRSTNPLPEITHRQCASDVLALLDHLDVGTCKAIGVSGGANTLLHVATRERGRIAAMVLVSAASYFPAPARAFMRQFTTAALSADEWRLMRQRHPGGDAQIEAIFAQGRAFGDSYEDMSFTPPLLATIAARTLLVSGDRDPLYPAHIALEMYEAIPHSYLWIIPNGGHGPIASDRRAAFVATATAFLDEAW
jgi:pimeloyl-ACP methyl ester carboxylesterase